MRNNKNWFSDLAILVAFLSLLFGAFLGSRALMVPDEARYVEIPREMVVSGDYITPHLNGLKYFEKPPMFYWLESIPVKVFGIHEWGLRIVPAFLALLGCLFVYCFGRILYNRRTGLFSSLILSESLLYVALSHMIIPDVALSLFLSAGLLSFITAVHQGRDNKVNRYWMLAFYGFCALAFLTKGLIAIVFPALIIGTWVVLFNRWKSLKYYFPITGILLFLAIILPWHILVQLKNPEFFHFYFIEQQVLRYSTDYAHRGQPIWFMTVVILAGFFPWIIFLLFEFFKSLKQRLVFQRLKTLWKQREQYQTSFFLALWIIIIWLFFTFSHSQLLSYALPVMPALALLTGYYFAVIWERKSRVFHRCFWIVIFALGLLYSTINIALSFVDHRSVKSLALEVKPLLKQDQTVFAYETYYQDLPVYLERITSVVDYKGELEFGFKHTPEHDWMVDRHTFWALWKKPERLFMIMSLEDYQLFLNRPHGNLALYPIKHTRKHILFTNHPL